eukprot:jgi/Botrbrau1/1664/Bobra.116_2s0008.1
MPGVPYSRKELDHGCQALRSPSGPLLSLQTAQKRIIKRYLSSEIERTLCFSDLSETAGALLSLISCYACACGLRERISEVVVFCLFETVRAA